MPFKHLLTIVLLVSAVIAVDLHARPCIYKKACSTDKNCDCYSARSCRYINKELHKELTANPIFVPADEDKHGFGCYCSQKDYDNAGTCVNRPSEKYSALRAK